ncbi:MAG: MBL fold metallo-hydrolase [Ruminiclostridium sp.]
MKLKIAGGCGEHGRNCFLVDLGQEVFMVDCGIMADCTNPFPRLSQKEIRRVSYLFLTHSHLDHTGALPWLYKNGFTGWIIGAEGTLEQLPFPLKKAVSLESICKNNSGDIGGIKFEYGRTGHCVGSVWYHFSFLGKSILFSGDYTEQAQVYYCDRIRGREADIAVLDCAYGYDRKSFSDYCEDIISEVQRLHKKYGTIFFPVPKYGRGIELLKLIREKLPGLSCCGDEHFISQLEDMKNRDYWCRNSDLSAAFYETAEKCDIIFISDPQLKSEKAKAIAGRIINDGGCGIMTGTVENGSFSHKLMQSGKMKFLRYSVHQNIAEYRRLADNNCFKQIIPFHSREIDSASAADSFLP